MLETQLLRRRPLKVAYRRGKPLLKVVPRAANEVDALVRIPAADAGAASTQGPPVGQAEPLALARSRAGREVEGTSGRACAAPNAVPCQAEARVATEVVRRIAAGRRASTGQLQLENGRRQQPGVPVDVREALEVPLKRLARIGERPVTGAG